MLIRLFQLPAVAYGDAPPFPTTLRQFQAEFAGEESGAVVGTDKPLLKVADGTVSQGHLASLLKSLLKGCEWGRAQLRRISPRPFQNLNDSLLGRFLPLRPRVYSTAKFLNYSATTSISNF
jgi:hypothetical protein